VQHLPRKRRGAGAERYGGVRLRCALAPQDAIPLDLAQAVTSATKWLNGCGMCDIMNNMTAEHFTPQMYLDYYTQHKNISIADIGVAPVVVVSWGRGVIDEMAEATGAEICPHWMYDARYPLYTGQVQNRRVSFAQAPVGAPGTVMMMEEMIACGARVFLGLGWAGSLQESAPVGSMLVPTSCIREEGTSFHYYPEEGATLSPDQRLVEGLKSAAEAEGARVATGPQWTIDAPYRELRSKIAAYQAKGVLGVDMETSAMYALGRFRGVSVCNLLVISDELWSEWRPAFRSDELQAATNLAQRIVLKYLEGGLA